MCDFSFVCAYAVWHECELCLMRHLGIHVEPNRKTEIQNMENTTNPTEHQHKNKNSAELCAERGKNALKTNVE